MVGGPGGHPPLPRVFVRTLDSPSSLDLSCALPFPPTEHPQEAQRPGQLLPSSIWDPIGAIRAIGPVGAGGPPTYACVIQRGSWGLLPFLAPFPSTVPIFPSLQHFLEGWGLNLFLLPRRKGREKTRGQVPIQLAASTSLPPSARENNRDITPSP